MGVFQDWMHLLLGQAAIRQGDAHVAIREFQVALQLNPNSTAAPGANVATSAAPTPITLPTAAAGTATTLASRADTPTCPPTRRRTGATATCAPMVAASTVRSPSGPGRIRRTRGVTTSTPTVAATDRTKPIRPASNGSSRTARSTATDSR